MDTNGNRQQTDGEYNRFESALRKILSVPKDQVKKGSKAKPKKPRRKKA
jgi:hypothetical protein